MEYFTSHFANFATADILIRSGSCLKSYDLSIVLKYEIFKYVFPSNLCLWPNILCTICKFMESSSAEELKEKSKNPFLFFFRCSGVVY